MYKISLYGDITKDFSVLLFSTLVVLLFFIFLKLIKKMSQASENLESIRLVDKVTDILARVGASQTDGGMASAGGLINGRKKENEMIRVLLAHFSRLVCHSIRSALHEKQNIYVAGCASTAEELQFLLPHGQVVLLGQSLVDANALEMLHRIRNVHPQIKVIVFGISEQIEQIVRYIEAGAVGYILQNESMDDVVQKLLAAQADEAIISPAVAAAMMDRLNELTLQKPSFALIQARETPLKELTLREREVLTLLNEGYTNKEIAMELVIDCGTVKNHVHSILKKLGAANRHEAATIYGIFQSEGERLRPYKV